MILGFNSALGAAIVVFVGCALILVTHRWHGRFTTDHFDAVQKFHESPTPRVGGLALMLGVFFGWWVNEDNPILQAADDLLGCVLLASLPAFLFGLLEDVSRRVPVRIRLLATALSGLLAYGLCGYGIGHLGIPLLDDALSWTPFAVLFTAFAIAGVANAYNIIDGFNGLTSAAMIVAVGAMTAIAYGVGDSELVYFGGIYIAAVLGFMAWNYPMGRLFLGDGGAYAMGFMIAWMAVALPARNLEVSPWSSLMACGYPVMETIYSMIRRYLAKRSPGDPDALHLHSLVKKVLIRPHFQHLRAVIRNAMVMITLLPFITLVAATGVVFYRDTDTLMIAFTAFFAAYILSHRALFHSRYAHDAGFPGQASHRRKNDGNRR